SATSLGFVSRAGFMLHGPGARPRGPAGTSRRNAGREHMPILGDLGSLSADVAEECGTERCHDRSPGPTWLLRGVARAPGARSRARERPARQRPAAPAELSGPCARGALSAGALPPPPRPPLGRAGGSLRRLAGGSPRRPPPGRGEVEQVIANLQEGKAGERGEKYVIAQFFVLACIVLGGVPYAQDAVTFVFPRGGRRRRAGPPAGCFSGSRPGQRGYLGLLVSSLGLSIATGSAARLVLTLVLAAILDRKATEEERALRAKFPEYSDYCEKVQAKIFPSLDQFAERYS
ncbi:unnamed protein product, partial [Prorocentrum cordatum]